MCFYIIKRDGKELIFMNKSVLLNPLNWCRDDLYLAVDISKIKYLIFSDTDYLKLNSDIQ